MSRFKVGDIALVRCLRNLENVWLTKPLHETGLTVGNKVKMSDILNTVSRSVVLDNSGRKYLVTSPTTEEYITLNKRKAQPIYPFDASAIANLADIHLDYPDIADLASTETRQYLEAGTGHGSLSLAIAQRIHAANAFYKSHGVRGAVLNSIDCRPEHSQQGRDTIKHFRNGLYLDDIDFHIANSPSEWLATKFGQLEPGDPDKPVLDGVFLDMADSHLQIEPVSRYMKHDSFLVLFTPSVTQILDGIEIIKDRRITLSQVGVYEIPNSGGGGGLREWDLRYSTIRKTGNVGVVCRPKVGIRVSGGGFVGLFKKFITEGGDEETKETKTPMEGANMPEGSKNDSAE